jgi:hypothetical protein
MSITHADNTLEWAYRGMSAPLAHRHYDTFELPEAPERLLPDRLPISFSVDREGNVTSLAAPLEPLVKDIVFTRVPGGDCVDAAFRKECVGSFTRPAMTMVVNQDRDGQLLLTLPGQPTYKLTPYQGRTFVIGELVGYRVEFRRGSDGTVNELIFHQPNGTFPAQRA